MKRKFENDVGSVGIIENPTKIVVHGDYGLYKDTVVQSLDFSRHIDGPLSASSPHGSVSGVGVSCDLDRLPTILPQEHQISPGGTPFTSPVGTSLASTDGASYHYSQSPALVMMDPTKEVELRRVIDGFVDIYEQLDPGDVTDVKPNYSYTELAYLAMLRSPNFCLPITEIYRYIQSRFQFYKNSTRKHWKNAVRHSLAKTMCFTKIHVGRRASSSMKLSRSVYLWCIIPNSLPCFARGDYRPSNGKFSDANNMRTGYYRRAGTFWNDIGDYVACKMATFRRLMDDTSNPGLVLEAQICNVTEKPAQNQSSMRQPLQERSLNNNNTNPLSEVGLQLQHQGRSINTFQDMVTYGNRMNGYGDRFDNPPMDGRTTPFYSGGEVGILSPPLYIQNAKMQHSRPERQGFSGDLQTTTTTFRPETNDPWLPKFNIASPDTSICSMESERRTPPYSSYDSGFDTCESSPEESSCRFLSTCKLEPNAGDFVSPTSPLSDGCELSALDLSPFDFNDLPEFSSSFNSPGDHINHGEHTEFMFVPNNAHSFGQRFTATPPIVTSPMTSHVVFTKGDEVRYTRRSPPAYTPATSTHELKPSMDSIKYSTQWQQQQLNSKTGPVLIVYPNGVVTSAVIPQTWNSCIYSQ